MIDEKKLIEELRMEYECAEDVSYFSRGVKRGLSEAITIVKCQPKVGEWIPVEERLPEEKGEYLVTYHPCYRDDIATQFSYVGIDNFRGKTSWTKLKYQKVIAWQPLLEPFKGETE